jgi:Cu2+-exporting ATPase
MSWWKDLRDYALDMIQDLDTIAEQLGDAVMEHVAPAVQGSAGQLDAALDGSLVMLEESVRSNVLALDKRYQSFMVKRVDPLFGQVRTAQLAEMSSQEISKQEISLNRRIAFAAASLGAILLGQAFWPASLMVTVPASFALVLPVFGMAVRSVKQQRRVTYHVVSAISVTGIWLGGFYAPAIAATVFYYLGEKLLMITEDRSHKGLISVFSKQPRTVWLLRDGLELERPFEEVLPGDVIVVHAGGFMPVDGVVVEGLASIDQQMLTGEAQPVEKGPGDTVYASTLVLAGKVNVRVSKAGTETVAAKIGEILNRTASYQLALQSKGSKIAHDAALPTLVLGALALWMRGPESGLAVLNSSFGVSVRISAPVTMLNLLNIASHNAILLKDGRSLELLSDVDTVVFDKTGTLTLAQPNVAAVHCTEKWTETDILTFAAAAEHRQTHPIALAILAEAHVRGLTLPEVEHARYEVGYGIKVDLEGKKILLGSDRFMRIERIQVPEQSEQLSKECHARGHSLVMVAVNGKMAGAIELQPTVRPEAESVIQALRARGLKMVIISGDQEEPTRRLAEKLGMDRYFANVLPEGKSSLVEQLQREGHAVCFVGDGINDSIALKKANVSVSLRGATTVATDAAQVVLMQESLRQLPLLFKLADEMERSLQLGYAAGMIPGVLNVVGVFLLGWGFAEALALSVVSMAAGLTIAIYPIYKHRQEKLLQAQQAQQPRASGEAALLPEAAAAV